LGGREIMGKNKISMKMGPGFYDFIENLGANRVKVGSEKRTLSLCVLPEVVVKYFKTNNDRYLELCKMEYKNGTK